jgi:Cu+-exporting ATPase
MHREFDPTTEPLAYHPPLGLYALTAAVVTLVGLDLWPLVAAARPLGVDLPTLAGREWLGFRFALWAAVIGGARTLYGALERLTEGRVGADLAVALASIAAILLGEPLIAAEVIVISLVGECLEAVTFGRTQTALQSLNELFPLRCWVVRDGREERAFTANLVVGDRVVVKPGGKVPADGVVVEGNAAVDAAALTGESVPLDKSPGDAVLAGCVVPAGSLTIDVTRVATQTVAGQVIALTAKALAEKGRAERLADRVARYFLPAVLILAALTFAFHVAWQLATPPTPNAGRPGLAAAMRVAAYPTLAVLVVACPCPLVLATPAAVMAALARLAGTGVLLKSGAALERLAEVTAFAFDKTGTLTEGKLELASVRPWGDTPRGELLRLAAAAEAKSEHPIARAVLAAHSSEGGELPPVADFAAHPGAGVTAAVEGVPVIVGTAKLLESLGVAVPPGALEAADELAAVGESTLLVAAGGGFLGVVGVRDRPRPEAAGVVAELRELGLSPVALLTGDRRAVAVSVVGNIPGVEVHAGQLPADKAAWVAAQPGKVAFVGDGVNDAPALATAHVGLAVGTGTDAAAEAGDAVLLGEPLRTLPLLVRLSRETVRVIRQNIYVFGFGMNLFGVLLTAVLWPLLAPSAAWYEKAPLAGVVYHQLGAILVLFNSMRLLGFERVVTGRAAIATRDAARRLDTLVSRFDLDELLHGLLHRWKPVTAGVIALLAVAWALSGVTRVGPAEVAVVQRFGAPVADLPPGLHLRWPLPVEGVTKLKPAEIRLVEVGFRPLPPEQVRALEVAKLEQWKLRRGDGPLSASASMTWASAHAEGVQRLTDESLYATGDGNLVEIFATVRYRVSDPRAFLFSSRDPDGLVRRAAEAAFRELAAGAAFTEVLTTTRADFERRAAARMRLRLPEPPGSLGVEVVGLTVHDLHPPQEVVSAYHAVAEAIQRRDTAVNDAHAGATRLKQRAAEGALSTTRQAEAAATAKVAEATAARDAFAAWVAARNTLPPAVEAGLAANGGDRAKLLAERRQLTDFRLALDAVTAVLAGRDKILIDSAMLPGKRHILLMDPDAARLPALVAPARPDRDPDRP